MNSRLRRPLLRTLRLYRVSGMTTITTNGKPLNRLFLGNFRNTYHRRVTLFNGGVSTISLTFRVVSRKQVRPPRPTLRQRNRVVPYTTTRLFFNLTRLLQGHGVERQLRRVIRHTRNMPTSNMLHRVHSGGSSSILIRLPRPPNHLRPIRVLRLRIRGRSIMRQTMVVRRLRTINRLHRHRLNTMLPNIPLRVTLGLHPRLYLILSRDGTCRYHASFFHGFSDFCYGAG